MSIELEFPGRNIKTARQLAKNIEFYLTGYEVVVDRPIAARNDSVFLGQLPAICSFCGRIGPEANFRKEAHAILELTGNGTLLSRYECDDCNERFAAFEDDLGKMTLLERVAGQVLGKRGVLSAKTVQKGSRIDMSASGLQVRQIEGDPIVNISTRPERR